MSDFQLTQASAGVPAGTPQPPSMPSRGRIEGTPLAAGLLVIGAIATMSILRRALRGTVL